MKKSLFAIAAVGAFAGAAQAQSSVTVYGILDVGFQGVTSRAPYSATAQTNTSRANYTRFSGEGAESTSRLGFRGTEDLGGGTRAFFTVEMALAPTDARLSGDGNNGLFNRQTFVGLGQKGVGQFAIGTQYTPIHTAVGRTDPGQQNNMAGNVIYTTNTSQGNGETTISYTVRTNNALTLQTDRFAGFQVNAFYSTNAGSANNTQTAMPTYPANATGYGAVNQNAAGVGVNYVWQKLNVDLAYQTLKSTNWLGGTQNTLALPSNASGASPGASNPFGANVGQSQMYAGAVYDFGILKAYVQYVSNKIQNVADENTYVNRTAQQIGVRGFVTKTIEGWASGGTGRFEAASGQSIGLTKATQNFTGYQLGSNYWLSKRTNMYAIFGSSQVSSSSINASEGRSSYGIGGRHTF